MTTQPPSIISSDQQAAASAEPRQKPRSDLAMRQLIEQVRQQVPFGLSEAEICSGGCQGCSKKLLDYLDRELEDWSLKLDQGEMPNFADLNSLASRSKKIYAALARSHLV
ncbi:hypothetical protein MIB92_11440 [Aestuariirhabdus sp. Z084]|uniref:hypothetical protein n=1 Tax=Aestuariirhabdus haliotis TaxID=2918751 RepID=UPI00201B37A0|nr:hypothetical protein [Aestuariirhabdus haliotis]MCL6416267.1 hypothetical protein [Aestuariirhabdus haliotis]MCL6420273.1 hypothetical protein [Aestuariirhabdus haliotis]